MPASGYTHCKCRECFDIVVSNDINDPEYCEACNDACCDNDDPHSCQVWHEEFEVSP